MEYKKNYIKRLLINERKELTFSRTEMISHFNSDKFNLFYSKLNNVLSNYWNNSEESHYMNVMNPKHNLSRHLFIKSFTHKSYFLNDDENDYYYNYERNEFIGDSHLNYLIKRYVFNKFGKYGNEHLLSKISTFMISKKFYKILFDEIKLFPLVFYEKKETLITASIKEDVLESFIHSFYCNFGIKYTKVFINKILSKYKLKWILENSIDYKTILNEEIFKKYNKPLTEVVEFNIKKNRNMEYYCLGFKIKKNYYKNNIRVINKNKQTLIEIISEQVLDKL